MNNLDEWFLKIGWYWCWYCIIGANVFKVINYMMLFSCFYMLMNKLEDCFIKCVPLYILIKTLSIWMDVTLKVLYVGIFLSYLNDNLFLMVD